MAFLNEQKNSKWEDVEIIPLQDTAQESDNENDELDNVFEEEVLQDFRPNTNNSTSSTPSVRIDIESKQKLTDNVVIHRKNSETSDKQSLDSRSITSSDTRSYREKLKDRIKEKSLAAKRGTQAGHKVVKQSIFTRINDLLHKEEAEVQAALERRKKLKEFKDASSGFDKESHSSTVLQNAQKSSYEKSLEFFSKNWDANDDVTPGSATQLVQSPADGVEVVSEGEERKVTAADYLGLRDAIEPTEYKDSITINLKQQVQAAAEESLYFVPSTKPVPIEERIGQERQIRDLRQEGIYVPDRPPVHQKNMNKFINRILPVNKPIWFDDDGELARLPDPLDSITYHPIDYDSEFSRYDHMIYKPAIIFGSEEKMSNLKVRPEECFLLEMQILNLSFTHHGLYSKEHVVATKLLELLKKYEQRHHSRYTKKISMKLQALRNAKDNLKSIMSEDNVEKYHVRLVRYKKEIKEIRKQKLDEIKNDNILLVNILTTWKYLEEIRTSQGYTSTSINLKVTKIRKGNEEMEREIKRQIEEVIEEKNEELEEEEGNNENGGADGSKIAMNIENIRAEVTDRVTQAMFLPEEYSVFIEKILADITPDEEVTCNRELYRRSLLRRTVIWFKIFYNNHEVCKSSSQRIDNQFKCNLNQKLTIRIEEWPETLSIRLYSAALLNKEYSNNNRPFAEIFIPIPHNTATFGACAMEEYEFSSSEKVDGGNRHTGVGSSTPFTLLPEDKAPTCLYTSGLISCKVGWAVHDNHILSPPEQYMKRIYKNMPLIHTKNITYDSSKIKELLNSSQIDPNDPNNASYIRILKKEDYKPSLKSDEFSINTVQKLFEFCTEEEIISNCRLRLLTLRDKGELEFRNMKAVPLRESEIPKNIFKDYEKRISSAELPFDTFGLGQLELHRAWGFHSLTTLYDKILKQCRLYQQHRTIQDMIHEERIPGIGALGLTFMKLLQPNRPLRPRRKGRKKIPIKGLTGQEVKVLVNVVRAFEVPVRKDIDTLTEDSISYVPVRPFVEVSFRGETKRTVTAHGPNPTWNQELQFSLLPNSGNFQMSSMKSFGDDLHIHLFDEIVTDILQDDRMKDTTIHHRIERSWLGSLRIPFSTLYFNHQVEGTFQMYSPVFLLGYDRQSSLPPANISHLRNSTFLTLFIIVQPPLSPPDPILEHLECGEVQSLEQYLETWSKEVAKQFSHRPVKTLVTNASGKSICVTRFFKPIAPPVIHENVELTPEMIARFVSLIPVSTSGTLVFGNLNVWLTCDQTIRLLCGEREMHAVLLCCYFMKIGLKCWLLLGNAIPHGNSAYILAKHDTSIAASSYFIWDPITGYKYSIMDSFSPLQKVYCLINDENIWVNIQVEQLIRRTNFDVTQKSDWWPAFGRNMSPPAGSIQPSTIEYTTTSLQDVKILQDKIEKHLRDAIMKWRPTKRTIWNRYCISALRKLLPIMEKEACGLHTESNYLNELQHILASHKMCGFPISQPFKDIDSILKSVKSTGVHQNENEGVEFAVAVYLHPYPSNVISVWVYAASLTARR